jgi:hypothetical protein
VQRRLGLRPRPHPHGAGDPLRVAVSRLRGARYEDLAFEEAAEVRTFINYFSYAEVPGPVLSRAKLDRAAPVDTCSADCVSRRSVPTACVGLYRPAVTPY